MHIYKHIVLLPDQFEDSKMTEAGMDVYKRFVIGSLQNMTISQEHVSH